MKIWGFRIGIGFLVGIGFTTVLYRWTEPWRVYSNDVLPNLNYLRVGETGETFKVLAWILGSGGFFTWIAGPAVRNKYLWLTLLAYLPAFSLCRMAVLDSRQKDAIASCANHSHTWWHPIEYDASNPLPASTDFTDLINVFAEERDDWSSAYCPGYKWTGTKTGVTYVGGGIQLNRIKPQSVLIAFCNAGSHLPPRDTQRLLFWVPSSDGNGNFIRESCDTKQAIELINRALKQAETGEVPYSPEANALLRSALKARQRIFGDR